MIKSYSNNYNETFDKNNVEKIIYFVSHEDSILSTIDFKTLSDKHNEKGFVIFKKICKSIDSKLNINGILTLYNE